MSEQHPMSAEWREPMNHGNERALGDRMAAELDRLYAENARLKDDIEALEASVKALSGIDDDDDPEE